MMLRNLAAAMALGLAALPAAAGTPVSGIGGLALSPDGSRLVAISEGRALYVLDPATLDIRERHWLETSPVEIVYSADGSRVFVRDTDDTLLVLSAADFAVEREIEDARLMAYAAGANILFVAEMTYDRDNRRNDTVIRALQGTSFEELGTVELDAEAAALATTPDGATVAVLTDSYDVETEPDADRPSDLSTLDRAIWDHQHDGEAAQVILITDRGRTVTATETWYSKFSQPRITVGDAGFWVAPYSGMLARIDTDSGEATLHETGISYYYGSGFSAGGSVLAGGGLRDFAITALGAEPAGERHEIDRLPGWPEYFEAFLVAPDGTVYAGTSAFMVRSFDAAGNPIAQMPLF